MPEALKAYIDPRTLAIGGGVMALIYAILFGYVFLAGEAYVEKIESELPKTTIMVKPFHKEEVVLKEPESLAPDDHAPPPPVEEKDISKPFDPGLYERGPHGNLPKKGLSDKQTVFNAYRNDYEINFDAKMVSIVFTDFGLSESASKMALKELPSNISFALSPYAQDVKKWAKNIRKNGHELWLTLPIEDMKYPNSDPGPNAILSRSNLDYNEDKLFWNLSRSYGYVGILGFTDNAFSKSKSMLASLLETILDRGLAYYELNPYSPYSHDSYAKQLGGLYSHNQIDHDGTFLNVMDGIHQEATTGRVLTIALPLNPANIVQVKTWVEKLDEQGLELAPLSAAYLKF